MPSTTDIADLLKKHAGRYVERTVLTDDYQMHEADGTVVTFNDETTGQSLPVKPSADQVNDLIGQSELIRKGQRYTLLTRTGWSG